MGAGAQNSKFVPSTCSSKAAAVNHMSGMSMLGAVATR